MAFYAQSVKGINRIYALWVLDSLQLGTVFSGKTLKLILILP